MTERWQAAKKRDFYYRQAKKENYRSRASYKIKQINDKYKFIRKGSCVVDLGAAPGGWSQVAAEIVGEKGVVIAVDRDGMEPLDGVVFIQGDMLARSTFETVLSELSRAGKGGANPEEQVLADAVISDMSPNISGAYDLDQARSVELCEMAFSFARKVLRRGGAFVTKIFKGEDFYEFLKKVRAEFSFVKAYSPKASRSASSETYIVATGFAGIDDPDGTDGDGGPVKSGDVETGEPSELAPREIGGPVQATPKRKTASGGKSGGKGGRTGRGKGTGRSKSNEEDE